jgi:hypothetical protein
MHKTCVRKFVQGIRVSHLLPPPDYHSTAPSQVVPETFEPSNPQELFEPILDPQSRPDLAELPAELLSLLNLTESSPVTPTALQYDPPFGKTLQYFNPEDWLNTVGLVSDSTWALDVEESSHHAIDRSLEPPDTSHDKDVLFHFLSRGQSGRWNSWNVRF